MKIEDLTWAMRAAGADDALILKTLAILDEQRLAKGRAKSAKCRNNNNKRDRNDVTLVTKEISPTPPKEKTLSQENSPNGEKKKGSLEDPDFIVFWTAYPNKVGKKAAVKAWPKALENAGSPEIILAGLRRYISAKPPDRSWMNPATFLNGDRWTDQPAPSAAKPVRRDPLTRQIIH